MAFALGLSAGKAKATPHFQFPQGMANICLYKLIPGLGTGTSQVKYLAVSNHVCKIKVQ